MKDDDFEVSFAPEEPEPQEEYDTIPQAEKPQLYDWKRDDPQDFTHTEPANRAKSDITQEKAQAEASRPFFMQKEEQISTVPDRPMEPVLQTQPAAETATPASAVQPTPTLRTRNGRTVLISGGDRGIGAAAARLFWQQGYHTAILYHKNETAARALINELGSDCVAVCCDVADRTSCQAAYQAVTRTFGEPDVLICSAGIAQQKLFTDISEEEWQRMIGVDLGGVFHLCQIALPAMIRKKYGRILNISSMWGQTGGSCEVHYSAAKAGVIGLTKALAKEEGPSGITVNCIAPGVIDTDMMKSFSTGDRQALAEETPVGRLGTAEEVARLMVFLAGEQTGYITGQVFGVNGGLVI